MHGIPNLTVKEAKSPLDFELDGRKKTMMFFGAILAFIGNIIIWQISWTESVQLITCWSQENIYKKEERDGVQPNK